MKLLSGSIYCHAYIKMCSPELWPFSALMKLDKTMRSTETCIIPNSWSEIIRLGVHNTQEIRMV